MKKSQENKLHMYLRTQKVCSAHEESWNSVPAFVEAYTAFSEKVAQIGELGRSQLKITAGVKSQRELVVEEAIDIAFQCAAALHSYGMKIGDHKMITGVDVSRTDIVHATLRRAIQHVGYITEKTVEHADALEDYGITAEKQQLMLEKFEALEEQINAPRDAIVTRKTITSKIAKLVNEVDGLITNHMDKLIKVIRTDAPDFYALYINARVVAGTVKRSRASEEPSEENPGESDDVNSL